MEIPDRLKGSWWDQPLPMEELEAITPLSTERTRAFELTPFEMLELGLLFIGNDNTIILPPTNSEGPRRQVIEDNSAAIESFLGIIAPKQDHPAFNEAPRSGWGETRVERFARVVMFVTGTAEGTGELIPIELMLPVTGFQSCMRLTHIFSDSTDAMANLVYGATSGLAVGLTTIVTETKAGEIFPDYTPGLYFQSTADNEAITVRAAAGQLGALQEVTFIGEFWYET